MLVLQAMQEERLDPETYMFEVVKGPANKKSPSKLNIHHHSAFEMAETFSMAMFDVKLGLLIQFRPLR
jgi:hypothetical protein